MHLQIIKFNYGPRGFPYSAPHDVMYWLVGITADRTCFTAITVCIAPCATDIIISGARLRQRRRQLVDEVAVLDGGRADLRLHGL